MKLATLLRIEAIKTTRRRAVWVAAGFLTLLSGMVIVSQLVQGRMGTAAPFVPPFSWGMAAGEMGPMPPFFVALVIVMLVTSEYSWRTARQNVIDGLSKEQFFVAKLLMTAMVTVAFMVAPFAVATATAVYGRINGATAAVLPDSGSGARTPEDVASARPAAMDSARQPAAARAGPAMTPADSARMAAARRADSAQAALRQALRDIRQQRPRPVYPVPDSDAPLVSLAELKILGGFTLGSLGFASLAFMLAMILRSTGGAIGVFFLYFAFLEQMITLLLRRLGGVELAQRVAPYLPAGALRGPMDPRAWDPALLERINAIGASIGQPPQVVEADLMRLIGLPLAWIAVFVGVTFVVFRKRDL